MPDAPPTYPRIPHLAGSARLTGDDAALAQRDVDELLGRPVLVEEKLDGANVTLWVDADAPHLASRGGVGAVDRGRILGPARAWAMPRADELRAALGERHAIYGEWLLRRHAVPYRRLPAPFVGFDVIDRRTGAFASVAERDHILRAAGVSTPPRLFSGRLSGFDQLEDLLTTSQFADVPAEGLVVRALEPPRMIAKLIAPCWADAGRADWSSDPRSNTIVRGPGAIAG